MLSFTKKNNTRTTVSAQTVEPASSSVAAAPKKSSSPSSVKKTLLHRASRRVQKLLGLKKSVVVAQLSPEPRVVFELGPASDPHRYHARISSSSSFAAYTNGAVHTRTTITHHINRYSHYDSLLPIVVVPSSAACPALSPTSSFTSSLESASPSTPSLTSLNGAAHHLTGTDADKKMMTGLTRADRVRVQRPRPAPARRLHSSSCSADSNSDTTSSFPIWTIVPASVTNSSFVGRPWEEEKKGTAEVEVQGEGERYSREAVEEVRRGTRDVGAERSGFVVSRVPVNVLEGRKRWWWSGCRPVQLVWTRLVSFLIFDFAR